MLKISKTIGIAALDIQLKITNMALNQKHEKRSLLYSSVVNENWIFFFLSGINIIFQY